MPEAKFTSGQTLAKVPIFSGLAEGELAFLTQRAVPRRYTAGEIVFAEGEPCSGLYVVETGQVRIFKSSANGPGASALLRSKEHDSCGEIFGVCGPGDSAFNSVHGTLQRWGYCTASERLGRYLKFRNSEAVSGQVQYDLCLGFSLLSFELSYASNELDRMEIFRMVPEVALSMAPLTISLSGSP